MNVLRVLLRPSSPYGQLLYRYQVGHDILYLSSVVARPLAHTIDIDGGAAILGLDEEYILRDVECVFSRRKWQVLPSVTTPQALQWGTLVIPDAIERIKTIDLGQGGTRITTDEEQSVAQIHFGVAAPNGFWVTLSPSCLALIADGYLQGLFVILEP